MTVHYNESDTHNNCEYCGNAIKTYYKNGYGFICDECLEEQIDYYDRTGFDSNETDSIDNYRDENYYLERVDYLNPHLD